MEYRRGPGSSPLTRGKRRRLELQERPARLIPTHAGKTRSPHSSQASSTAHPHSRGENGIARRHPSRTAGSSPLTRGKRTRARGRGHPLGLIPTHAGKTPLRRCSCLGLRAHPHSRGENARDTDRYGAVSGSSPLTRGKLQRPRHQHPGRRLIPTHAGKTSCWAHRHPSRWAHPHSRGENLTSWSHLSAIRGSSPLTRGKRRRTRARPP